MRKHSDLVSRRRQERCLYLKERRMWRDERTWTEAHSAWNSVRWMLLRPAGRIFKTDKIEIEPEKPNNIMKQINNMAQLRDGLVKLFEDIRDGSVKPAVAMEMNNAAGKAINSAKVELEYRREKMRNKDLLIKFMEPVS